jgi:uncharacterized protein YndB with AHSA1/START domain
MSSRCLDPHRSPQNPALDGHGGDDGAASRRPFLVNVTGKDIARGRFTEVIPVHRLAYSFGWDEGQKNVPPGSSLIEIDLIDRAPDGMLLRMTHSGLPDAEACASHEAGWIHYFARLAQAAAGGDPGPDRNRKIA